MRVLVIDDQPDVRSLIGHILDVSGIESVQAESGAAALKLLEEGSEVDVVLLDVQMPEMDGWTALAAIRAMPRTATLPVVMCTVKSRAPDRLRAWMSGCDGFVGKPFDTNELVEELLAVTRRDERARQQRRKHEIHTLSRA